MRKTKKKRSQKDVKQMKEGHDPESEKGKYSSLWAQTLELA